MQTVSPSSRNVRISPVGRYNGFLPPSVNSIRQAWLDGSGPEIVPLPSRSPGHRLLPFDV